MGKLEALVILSGIAIFSWLFLTNTFEGRALMNKLRGWSEIRSEMPMLVEETESSHGVPNRRGGRVTFRTG